MKKLIFMLILLQTSLAFSGTKILIVGRDWANQLHNWELHLESLGDVEVDVVSSTPAAMDQYDQVWYADFKNWSSNGMASGTFSEPSDDAIANVLPDYLKNGGAISFLTDHNQSGTYPAPMKTQANITSFLQETTGSTTTIWSGGVHFGGRTMHYTNDPRLGIESALAAKLGNGNYQANDHTVIMDKDLGKGIGALLTAYADTAYNNPYNASYTKTTTVEVDTVYSKKVPAWSSDSAYGTGREVFHLNKLWKSTGWMAVGKVPGDAGDDWAKWEDKGAFVDDASNNDTTYVNRNVDMWTIGAEYVGVAFVKNSFKPSYRNGGRVFVFTDIFNALNNNDSNKDILELIAGITAGKDFNTTGLNIPNRTFQETDGDTIIEVKLDAACSDSTGTVDWKLISGTADVNGDLTFKHLKSGMISFAVGSTLPTSNIKLEIFNDNIAEPDEIFILEFSNATENISMPSDPYQVNITILENDQNTHAPIIVSDTLDCLESGSVTDTPGVTDVD